jgi:hypothetical protein
VRADPPRLTAIMDEAVLHRVVGSPAVMYAQIERVIAASGQPNVSVQVIPYEVGAHPALDSTFILLEFAHPVPSVVYVEGLVGQMYLERPQDVERYKSVFQHLLTIALSPEESIHLMRRTSGAYQSGLCH